VLGSATAGAGAGGGGGGGAGGAPARDMLRTSASPAAAAAEVAYIFDRSYPYTAVCTHCAAVVVKPHAVAAGAEVAADALYCLGASILFAGAASALVLTAGGAMHPGDAGLLLSTTYAFPSALKDLVINLGWLEMSAVSCARLAEYAELEGEDAVQARVLPRGGAARGGGAAGGGAGTAAGVAVAYMLGLGFGVG
jgi:hypothetical protein